MHWKNRITKLAFPGLLLFSLAGCAGSMKLEQPHGFSVCNNAGEKIYNVDVLYGGRRYRFDAMNDDKGPCVPVFFVHDTVPNEVLAKWKTADGVAHQLALPVASKMRENEVTRGFVLRIKGAKAIVGQVLGTERLNEKIIDISGE